MSVAAPKEGVVVPSWLIKGFKQRHEMGVNAKTNSASLGLDCWNSDFRASDADFVEGLVKAIKQTRLPFDEAEFRDTLAN